MCFTYCAYFESTEHFRTVAADIHIQLKNYESQFPKISINILFTYNFIVLLIFLSIELRNKNAYGGIRYR